MEEIVLKSLRYTLEHLFLVTIFFFLWLRFFLMKFVAQIESILFFASDKTSNKK
jgi:hypothetical protein